MATSSIHWGCVCTWRLCWFSWTDREASSSSSSSGQIDLKLDIKIICFPYVIVSSFTCWRMGRNLSSWNLKRYKHGSITTNFKQVAEREGKYLVKLFNRIGKKNGGKAFSAKDMALGEPFVYKHLGSMASVGRYKALVDLRQTKVNKSTSPIPLLRTST